MQIYLRPILACLACLIALTSFSFAEKQAQSPAFSAFIEQTRDSDIIKGAIELERPVTAMPSGISGITVPHHLLAADLIARGVWATAQNQYDAIILLAPDHFENHETPFGVTTKSLNSIIGESPLVDGLAKALLANAEKVTNIENAAHEHGIHSVVPFLHAIHPGVPITAVTTGDAADMPEWKWMAAKLAKLILQLGSQKVLVVQSTDYSHHLPAAIATLRDQETLGTIAQASAESAARLIQPVHLDSSGAQVIQTLLQQGVYKATPTIIANRNSNHYGGQSRDTTSYVVTVWASDQALTSRLDYPDQKRLYLGGDFFTGRGMLPFIHSGASRKYLADRITELTAGGDLIVNMEGVLVPNRPAGASFIQHSMDAGPTLKLLKSINAKFANLANNHAYDFGEDGLVLASELLSQGNIGPFHHGVVYEHHGIAFLPLTFKRGYHFSHEAIKEFKQLEAICNIETSLPVVVLAHWGEEYTRSPGGFEKEVLQRLSNCGFSALIGAHSHQRSSVIQGIAGGAFQSVFSMGNLLFDQRATKADGAIVELRIFKQGTIALRIIPLGNLYEELVSAADAVNQ